MTDLKNAVLAALPGHEFERMRPDLREVSLDHGTRLASSQHPPAVALFPLDCVVSIMVTMESGQSVEAMMIGSEGVFGLSVLTDGANPNLQTVIQVKGAALQMDLAVLKAHLQDLPGLQAATELYVRRYVMTLSQTAGCNRIHQLEQRCARWLLMVHDRVHRDTFDLTQEFMATMLGVQRPTVSLVASAFQDQGLIRYVHGKMTIIDRAGLEAMSCECYRVGRALFEGS